MNNQEQSRIRELLAEWSALENPRCQLQRSRVALSIQGDYFEINLRDHLVMREPMIQAEIGGDDE